MRSALRKMGNSTGVIIPGPVMAALGAKVGDDVELTVEKGRLLVTPAKKPRAGWGDDARRIAGSDDALVWPEFGNQDDEAFEW